MPRAFFRERCPICGRRFEPRFPGEENCPVCAEQIEAALDRDREAAYFSTAAIRGRVTLGAMADGIR